MNDARTTARTVRALIGFGMILALGATLAGCFLFNILPEAVIEVSGTAGDAPFTVTFNASLSSDENGTIVAYLWGFDDGETSTDGVVEHVFLEPGTYRVTLRVTDNWGATGEARITITAREPGGDDDGATGDGSQPTASFTATPLSGDSPLAVTFNAGASVHTGHDITAYFWDFGDGTTTHGGDAITTHTFTSGTSRAFNVTLRVVSSDDNKEASTSRSILVSAPGTPVEGAPSAAFTVDHATIRSPQVIEFDPGNSAAIANHVIIEYDWIFNDGLSDIFYNDNPFEHRYAMMNSTEKTYTAVLTVIDDQNLTDTATRQLTVQNKRPIAGFEADIDGNGVGDTWEDPAVTNYTVPGVQTAPTYTVFFRSMWPGVAGTPWFDATPADPQPLDEGTGVTPKGDDGTAAGVAWANENFSYDPEGQGWDLTDTTNPPWQAEFANRAWGIENLEWKYGDGTVEDRTLPNCDDPGFPHVYNLVVGNNTFNVELRVRDYLGVESTVFTRTINIVRTP